MTQRAAPITNLRYYKNETRTGNRSATSAKQGVHYYTFGRNEKIERLDEEHGLRGSARGVWHDPNNDRVTVSSMTKWIEDQATENKYTYTAVLSLRDGDMKTEDFIKAMNKQTVFSDFRLIMHTDTGHDHAHVMMMRDKTLTKSEFNKWRRTVGRELARLEDHRLEAEVSKTTRISEEYVFQFENYIKEAKYRRTRSEERDMGRDMDMGL